MKAQIVEVVERNDDSSTIEVEVTIRMRLEIREGRDSTDYEMLTDHLTCEDEFANQVVEAIAEDPKYIEEVDRICGG